MHASTTPVFSLHYVGINLKRGVASDRFEAFVRHKGVAIPAYPGWRWTLLRGLRGERENQYLMVYQAKDAATYARYIDGNGELTDEAHAFWRQRPEAAALIGEWKTFATFAELPTLYTCYRLVAENSRSSLPPGPNYRSEPGRKAFSVSSAFITWRLKRASRPSGLNGSLPTTSTAWKTTRAGSFTC